MAIDLTAHRAPAAPRLTARSSIADANVELARHTLVELREPLAIEEAGERVLARLRRFVVKLSAEPDSRS